MVGAAGAGAQVVQAGELGIFGGGGEEARALLLGPFAVHQLVDRLARGPPRAAQQPQGDREAEQRVGAGEAEHTGRAASAAITDALSSRSDL